jgi:hypothetical protein
MKHCEGKGCKMRQLAAIMLLCSTLGCAVTNRHPALTKAVLAGTGVAIGGAVAAAQRKHCDYKNGWTGVGVNCPANQYPAWPK